MIPRLDLSGWNFLILFSLLLSPNRAEASSDISHFYTTDQLTSNLITDICQDRQGYIWIATEYGLNRFDGVHFTHYYADDVNRKPLLSNYIRRVMCDRNDNVWTLSYKGVQRYDRNGNEFSVMNVQTDENSHPTDIIEMRDGRLLILTTKNGLYIGDPQRMDSHPWEEVNRLYRDGAASRLYEDSRNRIWICSDKTGLTQIDVRKGTSLHFDRSQLYSNGANCVGEDKEGRIVVLSRTKVLRYDEDSKTLREIGNSDGLYLRNIFATKEGKLLVGTYGNGLLAVDTDGNSLTPVMGQSTEGMDMGAQWVEAYLEDGQHNRWIGCRRAGLAYLTDHQQPFSYFDLQQGAEGNSGLLSMASFEDGGFTIGQENGGIAKYSIAGQLISRHYGKEHIIARAQTPAGYWIGTYSRGAGFGRNETAAPLMIDSLKGKRIKDLAVDGSGNIYLAVFDYGLLSYNADGSERRPLAKGKLKLRNRFPNKLFIDSKGWLWIGHYNGIDVYDIRHDQQADVAENSLLGKAHTFAIAESSDGRIWVGTNTGLFCYDRTEKRWEHYAKADGLSNEIVCGIVEDGQGDLWISTYRGLSHLQRKTGRFINYYKGNGLTTSTYTRGIYGRMGETGMIYFGNDHGITYFDPAQVKPRKFDHGIALTGITVAGTELGTDGEHINLGYEDNTFTLHFSTMDFREAGNLQYEYRFADERKGVWHLLPPGASQMILSHLRFGDHLLQVRVLDNGVYSPVKQIAIHISPPWYRSWWAYTLYALILTTLILLAIQYVRHRQMANMNEEKIKFFVDISHELRSPLTLIKSPLESLLMKETDPASQRALQNMKRNTDRLLLLFNQILSIRKIEKGQMKLHYAETNLPEFVSSICQYFDFQKEKRKLNVELKISSPDLTVWIDREWFEKVIDNLITNAMKHIEDGGEIEVEVRQGQDAHGKSILKEYAEITVRDNGPGIDEAYLQQVFERFYQTSERPKAGQVGYGIGLNLTQKIVTLHGGRITARNRTDKQGSEFVVMLPLGCSHIAEEQLVDENYFARHSEQTGKTAITSDADKPRRTRKKTTYRVAVVDDEEEIRNFLQTELGESYHVQTYSDGRKALEAIVDEQPDLVVSDIVMPELDGYTLLKRLKNNTKTSHIPVILLTTKHDHEARIEGLEQGADAYISKPFNLEELEVQVAALIENRVRVRGKYSGVQEQTENVREIELKGINEDMMRRVMEAVNANLDDNSFNVEALADKVGMSRAQLHRRVKEATGITVGEFIRNLRLQQAARLLEKGDTSIQQVAWAVGFANPTHFSAAFKRYFGVSPQEYMQKHRSATKS